MPRLAIIHFLDGGDGPVDPGFGMPGYGGGRPDNSLPGSGGRPDNSLPGGGVTLPVFPFDPTLDVDNSLPTPTPPPTVWPPRPGMKFKVKWLACVGLILVPDNELPTTPVPEPK